MTRDEATVANHKQNMMDINAIEMDLTNLRESMRLACYTWIERCTKLVGSLV